MKNRFTTEEEKRIVNRYIAGESTTDIASELGVQPITIYRIARRNGAEMRSRAVANAARAFSVNHNYFDVIDTEDKAYFLGIMMSDGCVMRGKPEIYLCMADVDVIEKFKHFVESEAPIHKHPKKKLSDRQLYRLCFTSALMKESLIRLGCTPAKSLTVEYPKMDAELRRHFIRGMFDGDGSATINGRMRRASVSGGSKGMMLGINDELNNAGIGSVLYESGNSRYWTVYIPARYMEMFADYMYSGTLLYMERKYQTFKILIS